MYVSKKYTRVLLNEQTKYEHSVENIFKNYFTVAYILDIYPNMRIFKFTVEFLLRGKKNKATNEISIGLFHLQNSSYLNHVKT